MSDKETELENIWPHDLIDDLRRLLDEIDRLRAELAEREKDAERYRWLRDAHSVTIDTLLHGNGCRTHTADELDAAIDAAMAEDKP